MIISNQDSADKIWEIIEPKSRVMPANDEALVFKKAVWLVDAQAPGSGSGTEDNHIEFINENAITLYVHPKNNIVVSPWQKPLDQEGRIARVLVTLQLITDNRRRHGAFETIDPAL